MPGSHTLLFGVWVGTVFSNSSGVPTADRPGEEHGVRKRGESWRSFDRPKEPFDGFDRHLREVVGGLEVKLEMQLADLSHLGGKDGDLRFADGAVDNLAPQSLLSLLCCHRLLANPITLSIQSVSHPAAVDRLAVFACLFSLRHGPLQIPPLLLLPTWWVASSYQSRIPPPGSAGPPRSQCKPSSKRRLYRARCCNL